MRGADYTALAAFVAVGRDKSFTRAAARLGTAPSTLSHLVRDLEARLGVRLLNRTTRSVSPTQAGERLLQALAPAFGGIDRALEELNEVRAKPAGVLRLNVPRMAALHLIAPAFERFARDYPEVTLDISINDGFIDIVKEGFDAGVRLGEAVARDMTSVRLSGDLGIAVVASPGYFAGNPPPQLPRDVSDHRCICYRHVASRKLATRGFERDGETTDVAVTGSLILDDPELITCAALQGLGLAYAVESDVMEHLVSGRLLRTLSDWCPPFPGFYLYHPSQHYPPAALDALIRTLRHTHA